jgi:hypothetical protein
MSKKISFYASPAVAAWYEKLGIYTGSKSINQAIEKSICPAGAYEKHWKSVFYDNSWQMIKGRLDPVTALNSWVVLDYWDQIVAEGTSKEKVILVALTKAEEGAKLCK